MYFGFAQRPRVQELSNQIIIVAIFLGLCCLCSYTVIKEPEVSPFIRGRGRDGALGGSIFWCAGDVSVFKDAATLPSDQIQLPLTRFTFPWKCLGRPPCYRRCI